MKARCTQCGLMWTVSVLKSKKDLHRYECPRCEYKRLTQEGLDVAPTKNKKKERGNGR